MMLTCTVFSKLLAKLEFLFQTFKSSQAYYEPAVQFSQSFLDIFLNHHDRSPSK